MKYVKKYADEVAAFIGVTGHFADKMYVTGYGGNAAWKLEDDLILITPTKMNKGDITKDDVVFITMAGDVIEGNRSQTQGAFARSDRRAGRRDEGTQRPDVRRARNL
jgi:ribulose-5-phosphate 4-epimerase/fuculose-1-phosphate aldolase